MIRKKENVALPSFEVNDTSSPTAMRIMAKKEQSDLSDFMWDFATVEDNSLER